MRSPTSPGPWDDDRLDAAFAARARSMSPPGGLVDATIAALTPRRGRWGAGRRGLLASAAAVVAILATTVGIGGRFLSEGDMSVGGIRVLDGPTPEVRTLDAGEFSFEFPARWLVYDSSASFSGGSSIAVLGTQAVEPRCGDARHVEINCVYEQVLQPGDIRAFLGTGAYRGGTVLDRADIENGTTTRHTVGGMPAILDTFDVQPDSYYREDLSLAWSIGRPGLLSNVVTIEVRARGGEGWSSIVTEARAATDAIIASFRFTGAQPDPTEPPATDAIGLPIISVTDAIAVRDAGIDDRELAVRGWFGPIPPISCPAPATWPVTPVEPNCPDQFVVLTRDPESLVTASSASMIVRAPTGPSIQVDLDDLDQTWQPSLPTVAPSQPIEIVVIGHFDDRRSFACPSAVAQACRDRFVVDRVDLVGGQRLPTSVVDLVDADTASTSDAVERLVLAAAPPGSTTLSMAAVGGNPGLGRIEPSLGTGQGGLIDHRAIWSVRVLLDGRSVTYLVIDGSDAVFTIDDDGGAIFLTGTQPAASPSPSGEPSTTGPATVIEMTSPVGAGRPKPRVTVVDQADIVAAVREVGPDDRARGQEGFTRDPDVDGRYRLSWVGSVCDEAMTVTIEPETMRIVVDEGVRDACDAMGIERELVFDFTRSVDTTGVELVVIPARTRS